MNAEDAFVVRDDGDIDLMVHVVPGATRTRIAGRHGSALKVRVAAPPERGRATAAVLALLADALDVPRSAVTLIGGATSRTKHVRIAGSDPARVRALLDPGR